MDNKLVKDNPSTVTPQPPQEIRTTDSMSIEDHMRTQVTMWYDIIRSEQVTWLRSIAPFMAPPVQRAMRQLADELTLLHESNK